MRRLARLVAVLAVFAAVTLPAPPASAHEDVCAGWGLLNTGAPLGEALISPAVTTTFATNIVVGTCTAGFSFAAVGTISGWCTDAVGTGVTNTGHTFSFVVEGNTVVVSGQVTGTGFLQTAMSAFNCLSGSSWFTSYWALALTHVL